MTNTDSIAPAPHEPTTTSPKARSNRRRNILLALILAAGSLGMYFSIFYRLSISPLE